MAIDINLWIEQFLRVATEIDVVAAELHLPAQHRLEGRLYRLSLRLRNLSFELATEFSAVNEVHELVAASERRFRSLVENLPDNIARWDRAGNYLYLNPTHARTLGLPADEVVGTRIPDSHAAVAAGIHHVVATGEAPQVIRQELVNDARVRQIHEVSITAERDADGAITSVLGIGRDVTAQAMTELALATSERQFRALAENLPSTLARHTPDGRIVYLNHALAKFLGHRAKKVAGRTPREVSPGGRFDTYERAIRDAVCTGDGVELDLRAVDAGGERRLYRVCVVPEFNESGEVSSVLAIGHDITAQRRDEKAQQAQYLRVLELNRRLDENARQLDDVRASLSTVLQNLPDMVWMKDTSGIYLSCNHAFTRLLGRPEQDIVGKTDGHLFDRVLADFFRENAETAVKTRSVRINEEWITYRDTGECGLLDTRHVPVFDAAGNVTGVLGVARDITERKLVERKLASREREFRTLVEHSPDTVTRYGKDLRRLYVNPTFEALTGSQADALIGTRPSEIPGGPNSIVYEQALLQVFESGEGRDVELTWPRKNGADLCTLIRLAPEQGSDGTVATVLAVGRDITELCASREKIKWMAYYDALTSLPNRTSFNERLRETFDGSTCCAAGAVMMIDLDGFKGVNDTLGHSVGDVLLRDAAERLTSCVRPFDMVARLGGDEFAVLLPDTESPSALEDIAKAVIAKFDERFVLNAKGVVVSCSIGIALYPSDSVNADELVKYADTAMYRAKRSGRRRFCFYSQDLTADAVTRLELESDLRYAIERGELELHYQPMVSLSDHKVRGSEALLRWHRPGAGMVLPTGFISIAEETGLIVELGEWVLREACCSAVEWNIDGKDLHKVAVNLSPRQFQFQDFVQTLRHILDETGCDPRWLELEITESLLLAENETVLGMLSALRSMGLSIAIDDFGTGYSALGYLTRFPIDTLKIDRSFIRESTTDQRQTEVVKAILAMARCLGQEVVAEGVETPEQAAFLLANGCRFAQGFLYSKPLSKSDMTVLPRHLEGR